MKKLSSTVKERAEKAHDIEKLIDQLKVMLLSISNRIKEKKAKKDITIILADWQGCDRTTFNRDNFNAIKKAEGEAIGAKSYESWLIAQDAILQIIFSFLESELDRLVEAYNDLEHLEVIEEPEFEDLGQK